MERVCFRIGLVVAIRAKITGLNGVMITASHNQHQDNGVKIIEKDGTMLGTSWGPIAEHVVNCKDIAETMYNINEQKVKGSTMGINIFLP